MENAPAMITITQDTIPLRVTFVGHIDHGKSTLIGRLLHDTHTLSAGETSDLRRMSLEQGREDIDFAFATDQLREEREQGITIDTTRATFVSDRRNFEVIDAPGHPEFLKNMLSGATNADTAVLIIDAEQGLMDQTRRHAMLLRLVGIDRILVVVNKMDLCDYSRERFDEVRRETAALLVSIGTTPYAYVPTAAALGENVITNSVHTPWYDGPSVLEALDRLPIDPPKNMPFRFPVQDVIDVDGRPVLLGRLEGGRVAPGDTVKALPGNDVLTVRDVLPLSGDRAEAVAGECPGLIVTGDVALARGAVLTDPTRPPVTTDHVDATVFWMSDTRIFPSLEPLGVARVASQEVPVRIASIKRRFQSETLDEMDDRTRLDVTNVADVELIFERPIVLESHDACPPLGRLTIETEREVLAAGIVREVSA
jgi:small GTP-binding protein